VQRWPCLRRDHILQHRHFACRFEGGELEVHAIVRVRDAGATTGRHMMDNS
jgi:hypothetical protein